MNLFAATLRRGAWRLAKVTAATAISTAGAHMLIIPMFIEPAIDFASTTPSKILYGMIASCFGMLIITIISNILCYDGEEINGNLDWKRLDRVADALLRCCNLRYPTRNRFRTFDGTVNKSDAI